MSFTLREASAQDTDLIVDFLKAMQDEIQAMAFDRAAFTDSVRDSFKENTTWFLFYDEDNKPFGTCYMQSLHNYWRREKRFYLGGFYIAPTHRGKGHFKAINNQLQEWAVARNGIEIYAHIHKDNDQSLRTFKSVGLHDIGYLLCVKYWGDKSVHLKHADEEG